MKSPAKQEISSRAPAAVKPAPKACRSLTKAGAPCGAPPTVDGFCPLHSPAFSESEKKSWRERGQRAAAKLRTPAKFTKADFSTADAAREILEEVCDMARRNELPVSTGKLVVSAIAAAARLGELALQERVLELERQLKASEPQHARGRRS